jgi:hypothetical protein
MGVHHKLMAYSLNEAHTIGGPKARGFRAILGITPADLDYLVRAIEIGVRKSAIIAIRDNQPYGLMCEVAIPIRGVRTQARRLVPVTTAWQVLHSTARPRLVSAYIRG